MAGISEPTRAELARLVGAARSAGGFSRGSNLRLTVAVAAFLATLLIFPHATRGRAFLPSPIVGAVSPEPSLGRPPEESPAMRAAGLAFVVSVGVVSGVVNAQEAVQWRVEDGGNGHWYGSLEFDSPTSWTAAGTQAVALGANLACLETEEENRWIADAFVGRIGFPLGQAWIGGFLANDDWQWMTGTRPQFLPWNCFECHESCQPDYACEPYMAIMCLSDGIAWLNNAGGCLGKGEGQALVEWSSDCNADGIVDYGQILAGEFADANGNNIPDCCENDVPCDPCAAADLDASGAVNGVDLAIILNTWGTAGGKYPQADIDRDGVVGGTDLALILGAWGECQ
jgi:hypothetical protein